MNKTNLKTRQILEYRKTIYKSGRSLEDMEDRRLDSKNEL